MCNALLANDIPDYHGAFRVRIRLGEDNKDVAKRIHNIDGYVLVFRGGIKRVYVHRNIYIDFTLPLNEMEIRDYIGDTPYIESIFLDY